MTQSVHVELVRWPDGADLVEFLAARGLAAELLEADDHCEVDVAFLRDERERLSSEVDAALRAWLAETGRPLVPTRTDCNGYALRPLSE